MERWTATKYRAVVMGGSAGSLNALETIFQFLPEEFFFPIIVACHLHPADDGGLVDFLRWRTGLRIKEAADKELIQNGNVYLAPANYHLLVERDHVFSLSIDEKVNCSRPSIDVLFESAAVCWGEQLVGIILSGANADGAEGMKSIKKYQGITIAQNPEEAEYTPMVREAIKTGAIDRILSLKEIGEYLSVLAGGNTLAGAGWR